jgi:hypothetical protein
VLRPVYHGEHGLRTLRELARSYRYVSREETRERAVFQVDTDPEFAGYRRTLKHHFAAEESHAIATVATDQAAHECYGSTRLDAITVVEKVGIN